MKKVPHCDAPGAMRHRWSRDVRLVGGDDRNPGVFGLGGARMRFVRACTKCGCKEIQEGERGHYTTTYSEAP